MLVTFDIYPPRFGPSASILLNLGTKRTSNFDQLIAFGQHCQASFVSALLRKVCHIYIYKSHTSLPYTLHDVWKKPPANNLPQIPHSAGAYGTRYVLFIYYSCLHVFIDKHFHTWLIMFIVKISCCATNPSWVNKLLNEDLVSAALLFGNRSISARLFFLPNHASEEQYSGLRLHIFSKLSFDSRVYCLLSHNVGAFFFFIFKKNQNFKNTPRSPP